MAPTTLAGSGQTHHRGAHARCELDSSRALWERTAVGLDLGNETAHRWISADRAGLLLNEDNVWRLGGRFEAVINGFAAISALWVAFRVRATPLSRNGLFMAAEGCSRQ